MKTLSCDLCPHAVDAKSFEAWMEALKPHYAQAHADFMQASAATREDMVRWMKVNQARWDQA